MESFAFFSNSLKNRFIPNIYLFMFSFNQVYGHKFKGMPLSKYTVSRVTAPTAFIIYI